MLYRLSVFLNFMTAILNKWKWVVVLAHFAAPIALMCLISGPLFLNDNAVMIYFMRRAVEWYHGFGALWGYDPSFAAGYPLSFTWNSHLSIQFLATLFHPVPEYIVLLWATAGGVIIAPLCFIAGLRNFGLKGATLNAAAILMLAYWWCGFPAIMLLLGMPSSVFVMHLSFYTLSLYYRFFTEDDPRIAAGLYVMTPLCFIAHKSAIVMLALPVFILLLINIRRLGARRIMILAGISALTLAVNSFWLIPFLELFRHQASVADAPHGLCLDPLRIFKDYFSLSKIMGPRPEEPDNRNFLFLLFNTAIRDALLVSGVYGITRWWRAGRRALAAFFAAHTVLFLAEIYFGSFWSVSALLYPTRYIPNLDFMLAVPAAVGLRGFYEKLMKRPDNQGKLVRMLKPALAIFLVFSFIPFAFFIRELDTRLDEDTYRLTQFLRGYTARAGRVMLEDSGWNDRDSIRDKTPPKYGQSQFPSLMADLTGREFIGGPYPYVFLKHHYASFYDGKFLRRPLHDFSPDEISAELNRYYIRWIVCWSDDCKEYFSSEKEKYAYRKEIGKFDVFEFKTFDPNPFLAGDGFVISDREGIKCIRVKPEDGRVVLKYHAFEQLVVSGGRGRTGVAESGNDPVGFIEVKDPPEYFRIYNGYKK